MKLRQSFLALINYWVLAVPEFLVNLPTGSTLLFLNWHRHRHRKHRHKKTSQQGSLWGHFNAVHAGIFLYCVTEWGPLHLNMVTNDEYGQLTARDTIQLQIQNVNVPVNSRVKAIIQSEMLHRSIFGWLGVTLIPSVGSTITSIKCFEKVCF